MQEKSTKQPHRWKKGESGNPRGKVKDPNKLEALGILKANAPDLMQKAVELAMGGSEKVLVALVNKICPELVKLQGEINHFADVPIDTIRAIGAKFLGLGHTKRGNTKTETD